MATVRFLMRVAQLLQKDKNFKNTSAAFWVLEGNSHREPDEIIQHIVDLNTENKPHLNKLIKILEDCKEWDSTFSRKGRVVC